MKDPGFIPRKYNKITKNLKVYLTPNDFRQKDHFEGLINTNQIAWGQIHMTITSSSHVTSLSSGETVIDSSLLVNPTLHTDAPPAINPHDYATMWQSKKEPEVMNEESNPHRLECPPTPTGTQI